ncbi:hypothetical protein VST7929_02664 [Vibrio stylophorae]|uniref:Uncharacterized protein n=1 Tax=Vibrio stylophorae TaxID=659351 RepID=A0ABM8ZWL2_9VIBR|nr:hypothetical protein VST7929_02664 [Vibrio stylophorae]
MPDLLMTELRAKQLDGYIVPVASYGEKYKFVQALSVAVM